jgi:ABC-type transport system involved in multi-copper enzyme maturation permease subunit
MVGIALALLALLATIVGLTVIAGRGGMDKWQWRWPPPPAPALMRPTFQETARGMQLLPRVLPVASPAAALQDAFAGASISALRQSRFYLFSTWLVFAVYLGFLLPILSLSFATEALSGEREGRTLVWLLTRPLPRASIYLAKFVALLPWSVGLNLGGFGLLCALAGPPGHLAFRLYWPAVLGGTVAFCALFHLMGACFRRAAVVALVYSFFLETVLGSMPGSMKRISLSFYTRCLMFDAAAPYGVQLEKPSVYLPVDRVTAWSVLVGVTIVLLFLGMAIFARSEYQDARES